MFKKKILLIMFKQLLRRRFSVKEANHQITPVMTNRFINRINTIYKNIIISLLLIYIINLDSFYVKFSITSRNIIRMWNFCQPNTLYVFYLLYGQWTWNTIIYAYTFKFIFYLFNNFNYSCRYVWALEYDNHRKSIYTLYSSLVLVHCVILFSNQLHCAFYCFAIQAIILKPKCIRKRRYCLFQIQKQRNRKKTHQRYQYTSLKSQVDDFFILPHYRQLYL